MSRPAVRIVNDALSDSVDLLQMLIAPPPPPPPPSVAGRSTTTAAVTRQDAEQTYQRAAGVATPRAATAAAAAPGEQATCYRTCHACIEERRQRQFRHQQQYHHHHHHHHHHQQHQQQLVHGGAAVTQSECAYCSCVQSRVARPAAAAAAAVDDSASVYFSPRRAPPTDAALASPASWLPAANPRTSTTLPQDGGVVSTVADLSVLPLSTERPVSSSTHFVGAGGTRKSAGRRCDDAAADNDDEDDDDAAARRTMSTSLSSSRTSSAPLRLRRAADACRRRVAVAACCRRCWSPARAASAAKTRTVSAVSEPLQRQPMTEIDPCVQMAHEGATLKEPLKSSRRGLQAPNRYQRRSVLLVAGFLTGLFLVTVALLAAFVLLWPAYRRRPATAGASNRNNGAPVNSGVQQATSPSTPLEYVTVISSLDRAKPDTSGWATFAGGSDTGSRYTVIDKATTFYGAQERCQKLGGYVVHVNSLREQLFLEDFLTQLLQRRHDEAAAMGGTSVPDTSVGFWLGAKRARGSHDGTCMYDQWKWVDSYGRTLSTISGLTAFIPGKPDNFYSPEECLFISYKNTTDENKFLKWDDAPCDLDSVGGIKVLCEVELR